MFGDDKSTMRVSVVSQDFYRCLKFLRVLEFNVVFSRFKSA